MLWVASLSASFDQAGPTPEAKAAAYLSKQVAAWKGKQGCASCHHNGDAARALFVASHRGIDVGEALADTRPFLQNPSGWASNKGHGDDEVLMRLQFAAALAAEGEKDLNPSPALVERQSCCSPIRQKREPGSRTPRIRRARRSCGAPQSRPRWRGTRLIASGRQPDDFAVAQTDRWLRTVEVKRSPTQPVSSSAWA